MIAFVLKRLSVAVVALATAAFAHDFPKRPVTMIVPFAAGGTSDVIARTVAEQMGIALGQTIVIENVAGAGGSTALARASRAEPDGYTIAIGNAGTNAATYTIYPKLPFTPDSFVPIAMVAKTFGIIAVRKDFPAKDLKEFIAYAKANPGKINLGHAGVGSSNYLICKSFVTAAGIDATLVGYRGAPRLRSRTRSAARSTASAMRRPPSRNRSTRSWCGASWSARMCGLPRCPIRRHQPKPACLNSRRRAGTACSRPRAPHPP
ncbi:tripartite-type tricarboxylate transporter receptor subunit TctC [Bradyrhizobium sp. LB9.1b]